MEEIKKQEITNLLDAINRVANQITDSVNGIPKIEKDILKEYLRKLYELVDGVEAEVEVEETIVKFKEKEEAKVFKAKSKLFITPETNEDEVEAKVEAKVEDEVEVEVEDEVEVKVKEGSKSINQMAKEKSLEKTIGENIRSNSIDSLKKHIGINDKFQFINELFNGKMKTYNEAIEILDKMTEMTEAHSYLKTFQDKFSWDVESPVYEQFMVYIMRRFS